VTDDILPQLPEASWRDIEFPFTGTRDFGFQQEQAQHRYIFRDQQLIESLGRQNPTFRFNIPFRERVRRGFSALFVGVYPRFLEACQDRSAGILVDPIHGAVRCKCVSFAEALDVNRKDGVDVLVDFVFAPETGDDVPSQFAQLVSSLQGAVQSAVEFGANLGEISEEQQEVLAQVNREAERGRVSIFNAVRVFTGSVIQNRNRVRASLQDASSQMNATRDEIEEARDPQLEPLRRDSSRLALSSKRLAQTAGRPTTPFRVVRTVGEIGRIAFATANQITVDVLVELNEQLANMRTIPAGTRVRVPRRDD
jgi:prophage DNA circulation protein